MRSRSYKAILKLCVTENGMSEETERVTELTSDPRGDGAGQQGQGVVPFLNFSFLRIAWQAKSFVACCTGA